MRSISIELPHSLRKKLEELAKQEGFSLEQFIASAASEKLSIMLQSDFLEREARKGTRIAFEKFLASVPDAEPIHPGDVIK